MNSQNSNIKVKTAEKKSRINSRIYIVRKSKTVEITRKKATVESLLHNTIIR